MSTTILKGQDVKYLRLYSGHGLPTTVALVDADDNEHRMSWNEFKKVFNFFLNGIEFETEKARKHYHVQDFKYFDDEGNEVI